MKLYGTVTSPFVRRVRVVAATLNLPVTLIDTSTTDGQAALRKVTPLWKVPAAELDGQVIFDSRVINEYLFRTRGYGSMRPVMPYGYVAESNLINAVDGALEAGIRLFYLRRDGGDLTSPYMVKEAERIGSVMDWLEGQLQGPWTTDDPAFGYGELALYSALDWMQFRKAFDWSKYARLSEFMAFHQAALKDTAPG